MSSFILRYYYFLKEETASSERLTNVLIQNSISVASKSPTMDFGGQTGYFYHLPDSSGKMNILGANIPAETDSWVSTWKQLHDWETQAELGDGDIMGKLTVLVTLAGNWSQMLQEADSLLSCSDAECSYSGNIPLFRLSLTKKDNEAIYVYTPVNSEAISFSLLTSTLPILHGQIIFLRELDLILCDRNLSINREKEELEQNLIHILHTKLVMNQTSLSIAEELESDIEVLATAFAKLVGDKKMISDGIRRLGAILERLEKQINREPVFNLGADMFQDMLGTYQERLTALSHTYDDLSLAEGNYQSAIEVVQSKIQVMNSRTNIDTQEQIKELLKVNSAMQKQSLVYQYAAGLVEFIVLAYYSLTLWSHFTYTDVVIIPSWIQLIGVLLFSGNTVVLTHYLAEYVQGEKLIRKKLILAAVTLGLIILLIVVGSVISLRQGSAH